MTTMRTNSRMNQRKRRKLNAEGKEEKGHAQFAEGRELFKSAALSR